MILLDTNVLIWWATNNPRLGKAARALISDSNFVGVSAATIFEIEIKKQKIFNMPVDIPNEVERLGFSEVPISARDAASIHLADLARHDPFDQLLLAQAMNRGMRFLTSDRAILERGFDFVVDSQA